MKKHNKTWFRGLLLAVAILTAVSVSAAVAGDDRPVIVTDPTGFSILEAGEKGMFNIGPAIGEVTTELEETSNDNVLKFDFTIFKGAMAGVWTKSFPPKLGPSTADAVRFAVIVPAPDQLRQIAVRLEIKGNKAMQTVPLRLEPGWNYFKESIEWNTIGDIREVVLVVSPTGKSERIEGVLYFDLHFYKMTPLQKYFIFVQVGIILICGLLLAWLAALLGTTFKQKDVAGLPVSGFMRDILYGIAAVMIVGTGLNIYSAGTKGPLDAGFNLGFLSVGLMGVVIAQVLKSGLTGKNLKPGEVFQNMLFTGLLAASSARQGVLQAPSSWVQVFMFSNIIALIAFLIYQIFNARSLSSSARHLRPIAGALIVGTPYIFNWLLLVENTALLTNMVNGMTLGLAAAWPAILLGIGRLIIIFVFNEAIANGINLLLRDKILKARKAHISIFLVSLGVVVAGPIADLGSTPFIASLPMALRAVACILTTMLSFAGLWAEVYLITEMLLNAGHGTAPSPDKIPVYVNRGAKKGMAYSGILMALLYGFSMLVNNSLSQKVMAAAPLWIGTLSGAILFPLGKTIIESFDGSLPFFERTRFGYRNASLYARGAIIGFGFVYGITHGMINRPMPERVWFGLVVGILASGGVSLLRDIFYAVRSQGKIQSWRMYLVDSFLGAFVGSAVAFYLDALQVPVIVEKFKIYTKANFPAMDYITYPLVNKWGRIDLGSYTGGVKLLFNESLAGVINWSIAAWLFAINKAFMQAYFDKDKTPIKLFFSRAGFSQLIEHMIYVLRWGLWMSPIIFTGLRMMPDPTWYNQDGAVRSLFAIYNNVTMSPEAFRAWSMQFFIYIMAFDIIRILIWMDHMGLRVATLVNLSFLGLDKLDERIARFIGPAAAQRYIPDAVKRFATWAPLLIPFYLPQGKEWNYIWNTSESMRNSASTQKTTLAALQSLTPVQMVVLVGSAVLVFSVISFCLRLLHHRARQRRVESYELRNKEYKVVLKENGEIYSECLQRECDVSRRSYDSMDPCGRILYLIDASDAGGQRGARYWPVIGNFPQERFTASRIEKNEDSLGVVNTANGIKTTIEIRLPDKETTAELWKITVENLTASERKLKVVPYLEWVLIGGIHDRFHTQYARLYPEMEYVNEANAILACRKSAKAIGILASDIAPEGFLTSRVDFIGRARSVWSPRALETLDFLPARDTTAYPTFDPLGSLMVNIDVRPGASATMQLLIGYTRNRTTALDMVAEYLKPQTAKAPPLGPENKKELLIGHGEIPPGTPQPYFEYVDDGRKLLVHTPYTPRPFDHAMSNTLHSVMVTNRGLHTSSNGNSQQNRLTPDWPDIVTKETPTEAFYLYDADANEWYSPTHHPLNKEKAKNESEFGLDGTATFRMQDGDIATELVVFVPPDDPLGVYLLTVRNNSDRLRRMRIAPYFQMVLAFQPEKSGPLQMRRNRALNALFFLNPRNMFRQGWAFVSMSQPAEIVETKRGRFFGHNRGATRPYMVEKGKPDKSPVSDQGQVAAFLTTVEIPAHCEHTVAVILGQTDGIKQAAELVRKYKDIKTVREILADTRRWWLGLMETVTVKTNKAEFDRFTNWLKYQALVERIWARRGFYQTSGAYGFRDQLQDAVNMIWVEPSLARKQIILCAAHQFLEGDVYHWFFTLTDGRTAFSYRSHASDNPLWLVWGAAEYVRTTGDDSILDEMASYAMSEFPFAPLPKNKQGWGHLYLRTTRADSIYKHCMKSLDLVLEKRIGRHGLPLMGTGDWNDGLDEIGSEGKGESVWLGFFLYYIMKDMIGIIEQKEGVRRKEHYVKKMNDLKKALENTWRLDRYLRAFHDNGTEIGISGSGVWEIDALTAAWAVISGINPDRGLIVFNTALKVLEKDNAILLGWPALREDTKPYLGRSSKYPEGVRENGMYCHGVQWLIKAAQILAERFEEGRDYVKADEYRKTAYRLWLKISPILRVKPKEIELYGGQPNKQSADILTTFDRGRMIWQGYTGAAGWMLRQALEGVVGASLIKNKLVLPADLHKPRGELRISDIYRDLAKSPLADKGMRR